MTIKIGVLESFTAAMGEVLTDFCGLRMSRLLADIAVGATSLTVERSYGWPDAGRISIDGAVYHYTANDGLGVLSGIYYLSGGAQITGTKGAHKAPAAVMDVSQSYSALEQVRQAMLSDYAQGDDLSALGRNLGVLRLPDVKGDDQFRKIVQALAYNPKGTRYGIELAMNALVGAGNYTIFEDLVNFPCTVFISVPGSVALDNVPQGKTLLTQRTPIVASAGALTFAYGATTNPAPYVHVGSILLTDENFLTDCRTARPSAGLDSFGVTAWAWNSGGSESTQVHLITLMMGGIGAQDCCEFNNSNHAYYSHAPQLQPESSASMSALVCPMPSGSLDGSDYRVGGRIRDGGREIAWGLQERMGGNVGVGFVNMSTGAFITGAQATIITKNPTAFYDIRMVKRRNQDVRLYVNGSLVQTALWTDFPTTASVSVDFGVLSDIASNTLLRFKQVAFYCHCDTDYWSARGIDGAVLAANPTRLTIGTTDFQAGDVGKQVRITGSAVTNGRGGNNNCVLQVATFVDSSHVTLVGPSVAGAQVNSVNPTRVVVNNVPQAFRFPDDLGKTVTIENSTLGNGGTYIISTIRDPNTLADLSTAATPISSYTNVCEVIGASFVPETGLTYHLTPAFADESNLVWELSDAGAVSAPSGTNYPMTTRQALPYSTGHYDVLVTTVLSAQLLGDDNVDNILTAVGPPATFVFWPFYVTDPYFVVQTYIHTIVAAGIKVVFFFT